MIKIKDLTVCRSGNVAAISSLSLEIEKGDCCAVIGANGAGKTTLLHSIMGLLQPKCGKIYVNSVLLEKHSLSKIRSMAGLVFQNCDDQLFFSTVQEDIAFGFLNRKIPQQIALENAKALMEKYGILPLANRPIQNLSDGEKKRVAICSVLAANPEVLLLDEPTALLDCKCKRQTADILKSLNKTILMTTHDLDFAAALCGHCAVLNKGALAAFGKTKDILANKSLLENCGLI